jgi:hypothetical protein
MGPGSGPTFSYRRTGAIVGFEQKLEKTTPLAGGARHQPNADRNAFQDIHRTMHGRKRMPILNCRKGSKTVFCPWGHERPLRRTDHPKRVRSSARNRRQSAWSVVSGLCANAASINARCGLSAEGRWPPVPTGLRPPVRSIRCSHLIASESLTPNRRAAGSCLLSPPHRSPDCANPASMVASSVTGSIPAGWLNQTRADLGIDSDFVTK